MVLELGHGGDEGEPVVGAKTTDLCLEFDGEPVPESVDVAVESGGGLSESEQLTAGQTEVVSEALEVAVVAGREALEVE